MDVICGLCTGCTLNSYLGSGCLYFNVPQSGRPLRWDLMQALKLNSVSSTCQWRCNLVGVLFVVQFRRESYPTALAKFMNPQGDKCRGGHPDTGGWAMFTHLENSQLPLSSLPLCFFHSFLPYGGVVFQVLWSGSARESFHSFPSAS